MGFTREEKQQKKRLLSQIKETLNDFVIGSVIHASDAENETGETDNNGFVNDYGDSSHWKKCCSLSKEGGGGSQYYRPKSSPWHVWLY